MRIIVTPKSSDTLLRMFAESFDRIRNDKDFIRPYVITRDN